MKRYKLLKDLPGIPAGTILRLTNTGRLVSVKDSFTRISKTVEAEKYPDWFEELPEEPSRWQPKSGEKFYFVTYKFDVGESLEYYKHEQDDLNIFRSADTAQVVADAIRLSLKYLHTTEDFDVISGKGCAVDMHNAWKYAREAVQTNQASKG